MPETESIYQNQILFSVPLGTKELSARKLDLDRLENCDAETMRELYLCLADEFEAINFMTVAANCRKRAEYWSSK